MIDGNEAKKLQNRQEDELLQKYCETRDINLRNELIKKYLYIAEIVAKKFSNRGVEYDDLFQVASLALIKALERYDINRGYKFSSFATPTVVGEVKNYFRDKSRVIRLPRKESEYLKKLDEATSHLSFKLSRSPKPEEIAEYLNITVEEVLELMESRHSTNIASLDYYIDDEGETDLMSVIGQDETSYSDIENKDFISRVMETLDDTERKVIYERFYKGRSQRAIAKDMGVSQMYISRMERKILEKFRTYLRKG
ncbi:sigma-70 family RNA polymerase sigma factor [Xylanivirga thermophila]|jgi:RNA polymerase sigma-B factor|uniref:sigma-70 family RNA polymerase sigma factor n=1 Tax=Xylanivirga thermophila TaxID=2496273 RepID=UPI00101CA522|nr:sigma-70 family RNA polymerase sigma factor [Xylanivirga thermophila]